VETALSFVRGNTARCVATRIPRTVFRGSHSGLTALKFLRGSLKILQRLKRFLTPKLLPPSIYSRAKLSVIYRREKEDDGGSILSFSLSLFLSPFLTFFFFASLISRRRFRVSGETSFWSRRVKGGHFRSARAFLPSSLRPSPRPSYPVRHLQRFKPAALSGTLGRPFFFSPESLSGVKSSPARRRDGERGDGGARKIGKKFTFIMKRYLSLRPT